MICPGFEHWSVHLDRCDYSAMAKCKLDGTYHTSEKTKAIMAVMDEDVAVIDFDQTINDER